MRMRPLPAVCAKPQFSGIEDHPRTGSKVTRTLFFNNGIIMAESENMRLDARRDGTRLLVSLPKGEYVFCDPCCPVTSEL